MLAREHISRARALAKEGAPKAAVAQILDNMSEFDQHWRFAGLIAAFEAAVLLDDPACAQGVAARLVAAAPALKELALYLEESPARMAQDRPRLTDKEIEVLQGLRDGLGQKAVSHQLGITVSAVKSRLEGAKIKLKADTTIQAVAQAVALGLFKGG